MESITTINEDEILDGLPRMTLDPGKYPKTDPNGWVFLNSLGDLCIRLTSGETIYVMEEDLEYVHTIPETSF